MNKHFFIAAYIIFVSVNLLTAQNSQQQNYITSGYYQLVYEADIAYLAGNDSVAH